MEARLVGGEDFFVAAPRRLAAPHDEGLGMARDLVAVEGAGLAQATAALGAARDESAVRHEYRASVDRIDTTVTVLFRTKCCCFILTARSTVVLNVSEITVRQCSLEVVVT